jgi:hypothetical protein
MLLDGAILHRRLRFAAILEHYDLLGVNCTAITLPGYQVYSSSESRATWSMKYFSRLEKLDNDVKYVLIKAAAFAAAIAAANGVKK